MLFNITKSLLSTFTLSGSSFRTHAKPKVGYYYHTGEMNVLRRLALNSLLSTSFLASRYMITGARRFISMNKNAFPLVGGDEALRMFNSKTHKFICSTWRMGKKEGCRNEFDVERVPGSLYFDIEEISDRSSPLPHMLPTEEEFNRHMNLMNIGLDDDLVIYVHENSFGGPRVWWTFKVFGHKGNVMILDGGLNEWKKVNGPIESLGITTSAVNDNKNKYIASFNKKMVVNSHDVLKVVETGSSQIVDARSLQRFRGEVPEPRPGLVSGHIPGSLCLPFTSIVTEDDHSKFRSNLEIRDAFVNSGVIFGANTIFSCGSGVSAAILAIGMNIIGKDLESCPIYDGSWSEWGQPSNDLPKTTK